MLLTLDAEKADVSYIIVWEGGLIEQNQKTFTPDFNYIGEDTVGGKVFDVVCTENHT